ncbi:MAG TPA: GNAT family N-acetyltransferase [Acidothermaceae bacterium]|jgi:GNAT superfamily N-acetyltransferase|nr:GNAT family N-acetyltransferase [Acidothermaceae bacterium]
MRTRAGDVDLEALLIDGHWVRIRTVQQADAEALRAMHDRIGTDALYLRFFSLSRAIVAEEVQALTRPRGDDHCALVAEIDDQIVGVASFERLGDTPSQAEIAFLVDDTHRGCGVGTVLLRQLANVAVTVSVRSFVADTLAGNSSMLHVLAHAGLRSTGRCDAGVVHIELAL